MALGIVNRIPNQRIAKNRIADSEQLAMHTVWQGARHYIREEGIMQVPLSGPIQPVVVGKPAPQTCKIVTLHQPLGFMVFHWVAQRRAGMPLLPDKTPPNPTNEVLWRAEWDIATSALMPDGVTEIITLSGRYYYYLLAPPDGTFTVPVPPWSNAPVRQINSANYRNIQGAPVSPLKTAPPVQPKVNPTIPVGASPAVNLFNPFLTLS